MSRVSNLAVIREDSYVSRKRAVVIFYLKIQMVVNLCTIHS